MANDINSVVLVGRITRDCELKYTQGGTAVAKGSVAVNRYGGKDKDEEVSFIDFALWGKQAEAVSQYLLKGRQVCIQGELRQNRWEQDGQKMSRVEVNVSSLQLLGSVQQSDSPQVPRVTKAERMINDLVSAGRPVPVAASPETLNSPSAGFPGPEEFDDDIPF